MTELEKVIKSFADQVASGYTCKDKKSKYAKDIDDHMDTWQWYNGKKYGFDWCTVFFDWNFINALGVDRARTVLNRPKNSLGAAVRYSREYLKSIGRVGNEPKVGCAVYFGDLPYPRHIGFVYKVTDNMIYTYEGNCYVSQGVSGVKARSYKRTNSDILDYGYPVYADGPTPEPDPKELDGYKVGDTYEVVCTDPLMIRKGPGTSYSKIGELKKGDRIVCIGLHADSAGSTWMQHDQGWSCAHKGSERYITDPQLNGWIKRDGNWYFYKDGQMVTADWVKYKGDAYYLNDYGIMVTGWYIINRMEYYFYPDGHMARSEWIEGKYLSQNGKPDNTTAGKWKQNSKGWWFEDESSGWYPKNRSVLINRIEYEFDKDGYLIEK